MKNIPMHYIERIPEQIRKLYQIVNDLEETFPGTHFTPDGHLVGSIGEVLAAYHYDLELLPASEKTHDAKNGEGKLVQIKATQVHSIGLSSEPEHLLVIKLHKSGKHEEVFNGPGNIARSASGKMQKNGQQRVSCNKLISLMKAVGLGDQLSKVR